MGRPTSVTQTDIARAVKVATEAGLRVHEIVLEPRKARIILASDDAPKDDFDLVNMKR